MGRRGGKRLEAAGWQTVRRRQWQRWRQAAGLVGNGGGGRVAAAEWHLGGDCLGQRYRYRGSKATRRHAVSFESVASNSSRKGEENGLNPGIIVGNVRLCLSHLRFLGFLGSNRVLDRIILWVLLIVIGQRSSLSCSVFLLLLPLLLLLLLPSNHPNELSPSTPYCNRHTLSPHHRRLW